MVSSIDRADIDSIEQLKDVHDGKEVTAADHHVPHGHSRAGNEWCVWICFAEGDTEEGVDGRYEKHEFACSDNVVIDERSALVFAELVIFLFVCLGTHQKLLDEVQPVSEDNDHGDCADER